MQRNLTDQAIAAHVRLTTAADDVRTTVSERVRRLRDDGEAGAQAAEYAMLGGVSAAACTGLVKVFGRDDVLLRVVQAVVQALTKVIRAWF